MNDKLNNPFRDIWEEIGGEYDKAKKLDDDKAKKLKKAVDVVSQHYQNLDTGKEDEFSASTLTRAIRLLKEEEGEDAIENLVGDPRSKSYYAAA